MDEFGKLVKNKLEEYGYVIYNVRTTRPDIEFCIMSDNMMVFTDGKEKSITVSFRCNLEPEKVAQVMMVLNEIKQMTILYISESYYFDKNNKKYVVGKEAKMLVAKEITDVALREFTREQIYSHILATQKCHEC